MENKYVKGVNDNEYRTSDGFFRDPFNGTMLTGNEERCDTHLRTPRIIASNGDHIPISYRLWTKEERNKYNATKGSFSKGSNKNVEKIREEIKIFSEMEGFLKSSLDEKSFKKAKEFIDKLKPQDPDVERLKENVKSLSEEQKAALLEMLKSA